MKSQPVEAGPGQESVWDYPRPPRVEPTEKHIQVIFGGEVVAETRRALRVLETSHPPVYYIPLEDIADGVLDPSPRRSYCEWKGQASYYNIRAGAKQARNSAWTYPNPSPGFESLKDRVAFYPRPMDACYVNGEQVEPQPGNFYAGWITSEVTGPFKGEPGTMGW
jgi:uncharacterized protein (DUF427 family)